MSARPHPHSDCIRAGYRAFPHDTCPHASGTSEAVAWRYGWEWARRRLVIAPWKPAPWSGRPPVTAGEKRAASPKGRRPRVVYWLLGTKRIAIGRVGERFESLAAEIARCYQSACIVGEPVGSGVLAEHVAGWSLARDAAKATKLRKAAFLDMAKDSSAVERSMVMDDDLMRRMWEAETPVYDQDWARAAELSQSSGTYRKAVWKTERTGKLTTRGKPILRKVGEECWYGGAQLHRSPPINGVIQRWKESELIGLPVSGDWGTPPRVSAGLAEVGVHQERTQCCAPQPSR